MSAIEMGINRAFPICSGADIAVMPWQNKALLLQGAQMGFQFLPQAFVFVGIGVEDFQWGRDQPSSFTLHALAVVYPILSILAIGYR